MDLARDARTVLTLDAGGTTFTFSALRGGEEVVRPFTLPSHGEDLGRCLANLKEGFTRARAEAGGAQALSFAFPGPADYPNGIIGDLKNLPAFRGGVPLGPILAESFGVPVFLNNDGDLFAYGEAMAGLLPEVNRLLEAAGSPKRYRNLLGVTLGTGFGAGLVLDGRLHRGDNAAGGEIWCLRNKLHGESFAEESVSIRGVRQVYAMVAGQPLEAVPEPRELHAIALGQQAGHREAALEAFRRLGEVAGDAVADAVSLVDGLVVVGGGLAGAADLILPALVAEMNAPLRSLAGTPVDRTELRAHSLEDAEDLRAFLDGDLRQLKVPGTDRTVPYDASKRTGVGLTRLGTSRATALGAYAFALDALDRN